ncbi:MAG: hydantoinase/oxoprolinase family protein [Gemmatimonadetes bacterium]|nr:hydantoinase/oxoprolinase family protein [Gemmatimonadota bacterium]
MTHAVGIDVGGTFTDLAAIAADGVVRTRKVLSTPDDQSRGVAAALDAFGAAPGEIRRVAHGTTVVTNLLLERRGARVVLCATAGATDLLELRRQERASLYDLSVGHPTPLVASDDVIAVRERREPDGVRLALTDDEITRVVAEAAARDPQVIVVALLHAYADGAHETRLARALAAALPNAELVCAHEVLPEIREYERTATAVAEGYARPAVARYLARLGQTVGERGHPAPSVMTSGGGMRTADEAARAAASLALSGPAGGVVGAAAVLRAAGFDRALTIDIGGTSADAGLILDGEPLVESGGDVAGVPIALPRVLVDTVSAGGGSIGWIDDGGALRVGPRSAGAAPGPAAFGRGGTLPTVTDANLVLSRIAPHPMSGGVSLDADASRRAVATLAERLDVTAERTAQAMLNIADAEMARALRRVSVDRGVDPRSCVLMAFGGGGPLHACALADLIGTRRVLVPPHAGVLSALGLAMAPERREAATSVMERADRLDTARVAALATGLAARVEGAVRAWTARTRYVGQGYELDIACAPGDDGAVIAARFAERHRARYGFVLDRPAEVVAMRHIASSHAEPVTFSRHGAPTWDDRARVDDGSPCSAVVAGDAVITLPDATLFVASGWTARALATGGWLLERGAGEDGQ